MSGDGEAAQVELLAFEVGEARYAVDASQVKRVDRPYLNALEAPCLGRLRLGARALVYDAPDGERQLCIDAVLGVVCVPADRLRRPPEAAPADPAVIGLWLAPDRPVVLLDLPMLSLHAEGNEDHVA
jgi:chemotaxis signal transduction protein